MKNGSSFFQLARYYSSVIALYVITLLFALYLFNPALFYKTAASHPILQNIPTMPPVAELAQTIAMGQPTRLVIKRVGIDLPVEAGYYNPADGSWTLAAGHKVGYFAMPSTLANDYSGTTLIYGHNNRFVFGPLSKLVAGDSAQVFTSDYIFTYSFTSSEALQPDDASIFEYKGPPRLSLQTCTGRWYELRTMHHFSLVKVEART